MAIGTTVIAAYRYGSTVTPNVLEMLPRSNMLYFAIMLVTLQLCLSSAVGSSALFQHIEDTLRIPRSLCPLNPLTSNTFDRCVSPFLRSLPAQSSI